MNEAFCRARVEATYRKSREGADMKVKMTDNAAVFAVVM